MRLAPTLVLLMLIGCQYFGPGPEPGSEPDATGPDAATVPPMQNASGCLVDGPSTFPPFALPGAFETRMFRMSRTTGEATRITDHVAPIGGDVTARIEEGLLVVRRGGQVILATDSQGADELSSTAVRDGVLYVALSRYGGAKTFQALRLDAAPNISTIWCHPESEYGAEPAYWIYATSTGPLLVTSANEIRAIATEDGALRWKAPWKSDAPFTLLEAGDTWIACEHDVVAFDKQTGTELWRHAAPADVATDCAIVGSRVVFAARKCGDFSCTPHESGALAIADGSQQWSVPNLLLNVLVERDTTHAVVGLPDGVAVLDTSNGSRGATLAISNPVPWRAELLPDGDVLLHGDQTTRVGGSPLAIRWQVPYRNGVRTGSSVLSTSDEPATSSAWLVDIDIDTGDVHEDLIETRATMSEYADIEILATTPEQVEVTTMFGWILL